MRYLLMGLATSLLASATNAAGVYTLNLNGSDSVVFEQILEGFSGPKKIVDPEQPSVFHSKRWYESKNKAVTIACRVTTFDGELFSTHCDFVAVPANSSSEVVVERKANGVIRATVYEVNAATQMYKNLEHNPFFSNETVRVQGQSGEEEVPRLYAECDPVIIASASARSCVIEFVPN